MTTVTFKGQPIHITGNLPGKGKNAPAFTLTKTDLNELSLKDLKGKQIILNIFPSLDTPTCATSVRRFNAEAAKLADVEVLCISMDLPFAQARFCGAEGLDRVTPVSAFRHQEFGRDYGMTIVDGKLAGLLARSIVIINQQGEVVYTELVNEIAQEPDYEAALAVLA